MTKACYSAFKGRKFKVGHLLCNITKVSVSRTIFLKIEQLFRITFNIDKHLTGGNTNRFSNVLSFLIVYKLQLKSSTIFILAIAPIYNLKNNFISKCDAKVFLLKSFPSCSKNKILSEFIT